MSMKAITGNIQRVFNTYIYRAFSVHVYEVFNSCSLANNIWDAAKAYVIV